MILDIVLLVLGCILLYYGGEYVVGGASRIARVFVISPVIVGITIIAFGTSLPEGFVSIIAVVKGNQNICVSNIIGSNIINIGLILGLASCISPMHVDKKLVRQELPFMMVISIIFVGFCWDYSISRLEGSVLFVLFIIFNIYMIRKAHNELQDAQQKSNANHDHSPSLIKQSILVLGGFVLLTAGATILVDGAAGLAKLFGIPEWIVGITIVAIGTSLPELATTVVAAYKNEGDISLGNIIGSNIFNILMVIGISAIVHPLHLNSTLHPRIDLLIMLGFSILLFPFLQSRYKLARIEGIILLAGYAGFVIFLIIR